MPLNPQNTQTALDIVALEHLERHQQRVGHHVVVDGAVENVNITVVRSGAEQRQTTLVECCVPHGLFVVSQGLVGLITEVEIVPQKPFVERRQDHVITTGMNVQRRHPSSTGHKLLGHDLLGQIVNTHVSLGGNVQMRSEGMEHGVLHNTLGLIERRL